MAHPDIAVPVAVVKVVGGRHINRAETGAGPYLARIFQVRNQPPRSFALNRARNKRVKPVKAFVEVFTLSRSHNVRLSAFVIDGVAEITALLIPGERVERVFALLNIVFIYGSVLLLPEVKGNGFHYFARADYL